MKTKKKINKENSIQSKDNEQPLVSINAWLTQRKLPKDEWLPRQVYADKYGVEKATLIEWDKFFNKY